MSEKRRVALIVEDEMIVGMDLQMQLEDAGWRVLGPVGSLDEAQGVLGDERPDCALLDIDLADGTSFALAERLRAEGTRVVFLTGKTRAVLPEGLGDLEMLHKPLRRHELARLLSDAEGSAA